MGPVTWVWRKGPPRTPPPHYEQVFCSYFGFKLHVHRYEWEDSWKARYAQSDHWRPPSGPQIAQNIHFFYILAHQWKTGFQIVSPCCTYVSTVMRSAFADILVPLVPLDFMFTRAQHDPKKIFFFIFFIWTPKILIRLLLYLTCKLLLNRG